MDEKNIYNEESQVLTLSDKEQTNYKNQINLYTPKENEIIYKLPPKQTINIELYFKNIDTKISNKEYELLKLNKEYLESKLWNWKIDKDFNFELPLQFSPKKK